MSQFTKKAIENSFYDILEKKKFEKITVKDIVEDCGVNRKTFYYYFDDIYDLLKYAFKQRFSSFCREISSETSFEEGVLLVIDFIEKNKKAVVHLRESLDRNELEKYFYDAVYEISHESVRSKTANQNISSEDIELLNDVIVYTFSNMIFRWLDGGMKQEDISKIKKVFHYSEGLLDLMILNIKDSQKYGTDSQL